MYIIYNIPTKNIKMCTNATHPMTHNEQKTSSFFYKKLRCLKLMLYIHSSDTHTRTYLQPHSHTHTHPHTQQPLYFVIRPTTPNIQFPMLSPHPMTHNEQKTYGNGRIVLAIVALD